MSNTTPARLSQATAGTPIDYTLTNKDGSAFDLSAHTGVAITYVFRRVDALGDEHERTTLTGAIKTAPGSDGVVTATTTAATFPTAGLWLEQVQVVTDAGEWATEPIVRNVFAKL